MICAYAFVLVCLCITHTACRVGSRHQKDLITNSGTQGKEISIDSAAVVDEFDSNECSVKTVDGQCCHFPFLYKEVEQTSCVGAGDKKWCGVTYNYDKEKQWGYCQSECSVKTVDGKCCHFPFLYKEVEQTSCVGAGDKKWCGVTYNYDKEKQWGYCQSECSVKTVDGKCCNFPFLYKEVEQTSCVGAGDKKWCGVTYNYDKEKQWGYCQSECSVKTVDGKCCHFPFLYKEVEQTSCVGAGDKKWCGVTYNYDKEKQWGYCQSDDDVTLTSAGANSFLTPLERRRCSEIPAEAEQKREMKYGEPIASLFPSKNVKHECCEEGCDKNEMGIHYNENRPRRAENVREFYVTKCC
ncbi:epididymal sperm-binding protein 1-like isoform X2 [Oculina patagonica]